MKRESLRHAYILENQINFCETAIYICLKDKKYAVCLCELVDEGKTSKYVAESSLPNQDEIKDCIVSVLKNRKLNLEAELFKLLNS